MSATYSKEFYNTLPTNIRLLIFNGACILANGFINFDSVTISGTGGGIISLSARLGELEAYYPWLISLSTRMADKCGLLGTNKLDSAEEEEDPHTHTVTLGEDIRILSPIVTGNKIKFGTTVCIEYTGSNWNLTSRYTFTPNDVTCAHPTSKITYFTMPDFDVLVDVTTIISTT